MYTMYIQFGGKGAGTGDNIVSAQSLVPAEASSCPDPVKRRLLYPTNVHAQYYVYAEVPKRE